MVGWVVLNWLFHTFHLVYLKFFIEVSVWVSVQTFEVFLPFFQHFIFVCTYLTIDFHLPSPSFLIYDQKAFGSLRLVSSIFRRSPRWWARFFCFKSLSKDRCAILNADSAFCILAGLPFLLIVLNILSHSLIFCHFRESSSSQYSLN